jgi:hypothetical protein
MRYLLYLLYNQIKHIKNNKMKKTLVSIFNQTTQAVSRIQFTHVVLGSCINTSQCLPHEWDNVQLLRRCDKVDHMLAWDNHKPTKPTFYIGHWNDGII